MISAWVTITLMGLISTFYKAIDLNCNFLYHLKNNSYLASNCSALKALSA
jgi:hypothetical protein